MLLRRNFLKSVLATIAGLAFSRKGHAQQVEDACEDRRHFYLVLFCEPRELFDRIKIDAGCAPEFPRAIGGDGKAYLLDRDKPHPDLNELDWSYVPFNEFGVFGKSKEACEDHYVRRLNKMCGDTLLAAGQCHGTLRGSSRIDLIRNIFRALGKPRRLGIVDHDGWLIGVDIDKSKSFMVNPYRHELDVGYEAGWDCRRFDYEAWYGIATEGIGVLDSTQVYCGKY